MDKLDSSIVRITLICVLVIFAFLWLPAFVLAQEEEAIDPNLIRTESTTTSTITTNGSTTTTLKSPPASAITPTINTSNSDLCTFGVAGAVQTQILGISAGTTFTEENCVRLKKSKTLYDMGMKVAAVSVMCQDKAVFDAMMMAGTPCPYNGQIGEAARIGWESHEHEEKHEMNGKEGDVDVKEAATYGGIGLLTLLLLL